MKKLLSGALVLLMLLTQMSTFASADSGVEILVNTEKEINIVLDKINGLTGDNESNAFITSDTDFADSLVGGVLISEQKGRLFYYERTKDELDTEKFTKSNSVTILGGPERLSAEGVTELPNYSERIYGEDRFETAVKIAEKIGTDRNILIVSGEVYADALPATALAKYENRVILLVGKDYIPTATKEYLNSYGIGKDILFIGGENTISREVKDEVLTMTGSGLDVDEVTYAGDDRYETSIEVAKRFTDNTSVVVVDGDNYVKALSASILASKENAPLLLADVGHINEMELLKLANGINKITILNDIRNIDYDLIKNMYELLEDQNVSLKDLTGNSVHIETLKSTIVEAEENEDEDSEEIKEEETVTESENLIKMPSGDIIDLDNKTITLADGRVKKYKQIINMNSTSYDASPESNGPWGPITALGTDLRPGVVAVDPNVIPLRTELYVVAADDWPSYGLAIAEDTGGAIKGNIIDLFYESSETVRQYGRRDVIVYVLED